MIPVFCTHCGKESEKGDVFCRKCGTVLRETPKKKDELEEMLVGLRAFVDEVAKDIKKHLLDQIAEIEEGHRSGKLSKKDFMAEVEEIRGRLSSFKEG